MGDMRAGPRFHFVGERLCLDFVNTETIEGVRRVDLLRGFDDLVAWCAAARILSDGQAEGMTSRRRGGTDADLAFRNAVRLRGRLREMAESVAAGAASVPQRVLDGINDVLRVRAGELAVARSATGYELRYRARFREPADLLVPIAESAADLLTAGDLALVKRCQNPRCILVFYDTTKNHGRRWCSMAACGNRAKVAAHYRLSLIHI